MLQQHANAKKKKKQNIADYEQPNGERKLGYLGQVHHQF